MTQNRFRELVQARLTQDDVMELFEAIIDPLVGDTGNRLISAVKAAGKRGRNIYEQNYGELFPVPMENGDIEKLVINKLVDHYNSYPDRLYDITLTEREV